MNGAPLLEARNLSLEIGARALMHDQSLSVRAGELWCVLGPNGCGKTTLLLTLAGLRPPRAGEVSMSGRPLASWKRDEAARMRGFQPQAVRDAFSASVLEAVVIGRHPHVSRWHWEDEADAQAALAALAQVGLAELAGRDVLTLSGGERQRVAIATVLAQDPALLLLDEPVSHLDLRHQSEVMQHLRSLARERNKAILMSLHDLNLAARYATHALVFLPQGKVVQGPAADVLTAEVLSAAYEHALHRATVKDTTVFVPI